MKKLDLFTTSIFKVENFIDESSIKKIVNYLKKDFSHIVESHPLLSDNSKSSHFSKEKSIIDIIENKLGFKNLKLKIEKLLNEVSVEMGYKKNIILYNSWINIQTKNSFLKRHSHGNSIISGVLFLKTDKLSSKLFFYNPNPYVLVNEYEILNSSNFQHYWFEPKKGDLFLFPAWLQHGSDVELNKSDERISLSFNTTSKT